MIITVTPNPAIDVTLTVGVMNPGHTHRVPPGARRAGGKGINVARVLGDMGTDAVAIAPVGTLDRAWFADDLGTVRSELVDVPGNVRQSTAVVEPHQTTVFNETGSDRGPQVWDDLVAAVSRLLPGATCLVVSGSLPPGCPPALYGQLVSLGRAQGIPVIADGTGEALRSAAEAGASVLKPNASELIETTGETDAIRGARVLQALGADLVLVSLGEDGMLAIERDPSQPVLQAKLGRVLSGNPTGAGDAAVAGVASLLARSDSEAPVSPASTLDGPVDVRVPFDVRALLVRATAWSAAAVLEPLAGTVDPLRVAELEGAIQVSVVPETPPVRSAAPSSPASPSSAPCSPASPSSAPSSPAPSSPAPSEGSS